MVNINKHNMVANSTTFTDSKRGCSFVPMSMAMGLSGVHT